MLEPCSWPHLWKKQRSYDVLIKKAQPVSQRYTQVTCEKGQSNANLSKRVKTGGVESWGHTGAKGVTLCFSAASIRTANTSAAVMNISMKTPWAEFTPFCRNVLRWKHEFSSHTEEKKQTPTWKPATQRWAPKLNRLQQSHQIVGQCNTANIGQV